MARRSHRLSAILAVSMLAGACISRAPADPLTGSPVTRSSSVAATQTVVKVAFIEDLSSDEAVGRVLPALQAAGLAFANATLAGALPVGVDLVPWDTQGDPSRTADVVKEITTDPTYVAAIIAPYLDDQAGLAAELDVASLPMLSLSSRQSALGAAGSTAWRRMVANRAEEAAAVAAYVDALPAKSGVRCTARGPDPADARSVHLFARGLGGAPGLSVSVADPEAASAAATAIDDAGCGVVLWAGPVAIAEALRTALTARGAHVVLVGDEELKDDAYPRVVGAAGEGTVALCPCADLSLSTGLAAQRFIQDFQAEHGLPPGPYAAEAWDAAKMLVRALGSGASSRQGVLGFIDASGPFQGLANRYGFAPGGELDPASAIVHVYRVQGGRWIEFRSR